MGEYYGSVHVRTAERDRVKAAAEAVMRARRERALVGPALRGWVGVYPDGNGQDPAVAEGIARRTGGLVVHMQVLDGLIFGYRIWRDGNLIDAYWSAPGYPGPEDTMGQWQMAGDAKLLAEIGGRSVDEFEGMLTRDDEGGRGDFLIDAVRRMDRFAGALRIANVLGSFETLEENHAEIRGWEKFEEVPDRAARRARRKWREGIQRLNAEVDRLKSAGELFINRVRRGAIPRAAATTDGGFVVAWDAGRFTRVKRYAAGGGAGVLLSEDHGPVRAVTGADELIAVAHTSAVQIRSASDWAIRREIPDDDGPAGVALSHDGGLIAYSTPEEIVVLETKSGEERGRVLGRPGAMPAIHPGGKWVVALAGGLIVAPIRAQAPRATLLIGGTRPRDDADTAGVIRQQWADADPDGLLARQREEMEKVLANLPADYPEAQRAMIRQSIEAALQQTQTHMANARSGQLQAAVEGREKPLAVCFSRDGERLFVGTDRGLRVYRWADVERAAESALSADSPADMPTPEFTSDLTATTSVDSTDDAAKAIAAIAEEPGRAAVVFGGSGPAVLRMGLSDGRVEEICQLPQGGPVVGLAFSADGRRLAVASVPRLGPPRKSKPRQISGVWQVWAYGSTTNVE